MMLPRLIGVTAFVFAAMAISGLASAASASDVRTMPMQFEWRKEGPASVCGDNCRVWISAIGAINRDTPGDFAAFARNHDVNGATLVLDSSGGSVLGTLALGRVIRQFGMTTTVGKTQTLPAGGPDEGRSTLSSRAECESMCAFLLLSGTKRFVPPEAQVLVHEIWLGDRRDDAAAAAYSAEDIVVVQRDIGRLAQYTVEMGGSIDLLETALRIPPWEPMRRLSPSELRRMKLDTVAGLPDHGSQAAAVSPASGRPVGRTSTFTDRGWKVSEKSVPPTLTRRHPLTQEGDEIGNFDLSFACGDASDTYNVTYTERRRGLETRPASEALKQVTIAVGRRSVQLDVIASEVRAKPHELDSTARGVVPAALIKALATEGNRSLTISAATTGNVETVIRMGNTGVAQNLPRFASGCSEQAARRVGTHAELLPAKAAAAAGN